MPSACHGWPALSRAEESYIREHRQAGVTQQKYVKILGLKMIQVFPVLFYFILFADFCGSTNLEAFISKEPGINEATTRCLVQGISQHCGLVSLSSFY